MDTIAIQTKQGYFQFSKVKEINMDNGIVTVSYIKDGVFIEQSIYMSEVLSIYII